MDSLSMEPLTSQAEDELLSREVPVNLLALRGQLAGHPEYLNMVLRALNLEELERVMSYSNPSARAPYHGFTHLSAVVVAVYEAAIFHDLDLEETKALVIAAALHDFNHWGALPRPGPVLDSVNIAAAIAGTRLLANRLSFDLELVEGLIASTEYPYTGEPKSLLEMILRDADLTMPLLTDELALELFKGLYLEQVENHCELSYAEFCDKVVSFYANVSPYTSWAASLRRDGRFNDRVNRVVTLLQENS